MESTGGIGSSFVNSKQVPEKIIKENGQKLNYQLGKLFLNKKLNSNFEEGLEQGSIGLVRFSKLDMWKRINNSETRSAEYSILRFINSDSEGNAILNYKTIYPKIPAPFLDKDIIKLSAKSIDRFKKYKHLYFFLK